MLCSLCVTKRVCVTHVEGFALKLLCGVCNTPYPAIPNCFAILDWFPPPTGRKHLRPSSLVLRPRPVGYGDYKREKHSENKNTSICAPQLCKYRSIERSVCSITTFCKSSGSSENRLNNRSPQKRQYRSSAWQGFPQ